MTQISQNSQILDRLITEWRVFIDVLPVFSIGIRETWTLISDPKNMCMGGLDEANDTFDKHNVPFEEKLRILSFYLEEIEKIRPLGLLRWDRFTSCKTNLASLLDAFEELVHEEVLDDEASSDDAFQDAATDATHGSIISAISGLSASVVSYFSPYKSFSTTVRGVNPDPPSPLSRASSFENEHSPVYQYPKLEALAIRFQQHGKETHLSLLCQQFIRISHTHEQVDEIKKRTMWLYKSFSDANSAANLPSRVSIRTEETTCHWDYRQPWNSSSDLFYLLGENANEDGHLVRLQLDGRGLNRREANNYVSFSMFISKCPNLLPSEEWKEGEFITVPSAVDEDEEFFLCDFAISSHSPEVKRILFTTKLLLTPEEPRISRSPFPDAYPTISLAELLERGVLFPGERCLFEKEDKAVLAFSIGLCLLHLFYSLWMRQEWTANSIHFLHKRTRTGSQIFNIHFPYIATSLFRSKPIKELKITTVGYRSHLLSFAQLLVEIETGSLFVPRQGESFEIQLLNRAQYIETQGNKGCAEAIRGCIELTKPPSKSGTLPQPRSKATSRSRRAASSEISFNSLRKSIFQNVVRPLEINYRKSQSTIKKHRYGPFDIPGPTTSAVQLPAIACHRDGSISGSIFCFDDLIPPTASALAEARANIFFDNFSTFRKHFIMPKMIDRRGGRRRMRIAVLDTGIDEEDKWLDETLSKVAEIRENQGFCGSPETNPIKGYWPHKDDAIDEVGHGTWLAYLLLKYAPDADLYIAKVSKGMNFSDTTKVVDAFNWALKEEVDIISMSFGSREHIAALETAIVDCKDKAIIFASASNYGLNDPRTYPARDDRVICVHALDGLGGLDSINPATEAKSNYGTLGLGIKLNWQGKAECRSGTSYATPILAAISATLLDWLHYHSENTQSTLSPAQYTYLKRTARMREVFENHMSENRGDLLYIAPWIFFKSNGLSKMEAIVSAEKMDEERKYVKEKEITIIEAIRDKLPILS
ncbi:hypothetical protein F5B22DRAFT_423458 [Xylaria bambusicola]|uniref:uncharacterized protein n=1 Tax=Xylaria bambusicola TaxID=326684 RepID=UPI002007CF50|nr:uncharacterized protein F5B22DRAFT_423458 [Xylaria bambusicola]KAI0523944.1 hypothetical protein F5B22DRAFT_423458 [Xylaria bambusicola]